VVADTEAKTTDRIEAWTAVCLPALTNVVANGTIGF
jgi:hypothetical protein